VAMYREYVQQTKEGSPMALWKKMPALMLAKASESLALRKAFPEQLSGLYSNEEMQQADSTPAAIMERKPAAIAPAATPSQAKREIQTRIAQLKTECEFHMGQQGGLEAFADLLRQHDVADENSFKTHGAARKFIAELDSKLENLRKAPAAVAEDKSDWLPAEWADVPAQEEPASV
jgi:hypothetical protein